MKNFKTQFNNMMTHSGFKICFFAVLLIAFANTFLLLLHSYGGYRGYLIDISDASLLNFYSPLVNIFHIISLCLLILPHGLSNTRKNDLYGKLNQDNVVSFKDYCLSGMLVSFLGTFAAFFIPLVISLFVNGFFFEPTGILGSGFSIYEFNGAADIAGTNCNDTILNPGYCVIPIKLYMRNPQLYNVLYALMYSLVMGILASHVFQMSFYFKRNIYVIVYVYMLYYIILWLQGGLGRYYESRYELDFFSYITVSYNMNLHPYYLIGFVLVILIASIPLYRHKKLEVLG
ncbi:MAG: hypothetical protein K2K56_06805 [Lachnospiraceae bacterium]|nr:hypothetical protein [Lachnospiraceae bacterium]